MGALSLVDVAVITICSLMTCMVWSYVASRRTQGEASSEKPRNTRVPSALTFDFDETGELAATNGLGDAFLTQIGLDAPNWKRFRAAMIERFPELPGGITLTDRPRFNVVPPASPADPMEIGIEQHSNGITVFVEGQVSGREANLAALHEIFTSQSNLGLIRLAGENAPFPIWQAMPDGRIGWVNAAYKSLDSQILRNASAPNEPLFGLPSDIAPDSRTRVSVRDTERNRTYWFDVMRRPCPEGDLYFATDVHAVVKAESAQRNFVQTLAKTFAHLATGLAIFDRNRQLMLFNPALIDLTRLPVDFLSGRPNLFSFFDQLRDQQVMPEPKNYANWRERIADIVTAAIDDNFLETWSLPTGQTYRVTGRPHPDGAIAFLIEDITSEISQTRNFRTEMATMISAMDALEDSVAVFSQDGTLQLCNETLRTTWGIGPSADGPALTVQDVTRICQDKSQPNPIWGEIRDFITGYSERAAWSGTVVLLDGRVFDVGVAPLTNGAGLVTFRNRHGSKSSPDRGAREPQKQIASA